jgi:hypothetical protein
MSSPGSALENALDNDINRATESGSSDVEIATVSTQLVLAHRVLPVFDDDDVFG